MLFSHGLSPKKIPCRRARTTNGNTGPVADQNYKMLNCLIFCCIDINLFVCLFGAFRTTPELFYSFGELSEDTLHSQLLLERLLMELSLPILTT